MANYEKGKRSKVIDCPGRLVSVVMILLIFSMISLDIIINLESDSRD